MDNTATETQESTQEQPKPIMNSNQIIESMAKLFAALESKYTITEANMRGALSTMLHELNKNT